MSARRPAVAADEPFLRLLYASTRPEVADWPRELREQFLAQQFDAQRRGWREMFPRSEHDLLLRDARPVGRLWVDWSEDACLIVDLALLPAHRRQGVGTEAVRALLRRADRVRVPTRAHVERTNAASRAFFARLGFLEDDDEALFIGIERACCLAHTAASAS